VYVFKFSLATFIGLTPLLEDLTRENSSKEALGYSCNFCGRTRNDITAMKLHMEAYHFPSFEGHTCDICNKHCKTKHALSCHKSRYHKSWTHISDFWINGFVLGLIISNFGQSLEEVTSENCEKSIDGFICKVCGITVKDFYAAKNHMEAKHFNSHGGYRCEHCNKSCATRNAYSCHKSRCLKKSRTFLQ